jgi:hypothetical protein
MTTQLYELKIIKKLSSIMLLFTLFNCQNTNKNYRVTEGILILNSNPLVSIDAYNDIQDVIIKGEIMSRESLASQYKED